MYRQATKINGLFKITSNGRLGFKLGGNAPTHFGSSHTVIARNQFLPFYSINSIPNSEIPANTRPEYTVDSFSKMNGLVPLLESLRIDIHNHSRPVANLKNNFSMPKHTENDKLNPLKKNIQDKFDQLKTRENAKEIQVLLKNYLDENGGPGVFLIDEELKLIDAVVKAIIKENSQEVNLTLSEEQINDLKKLIQEEPRDIFDTSDIETQEFAKDILPDVDFYLQCFNAFRNDKEELNTLSVKELRNFNVLMASFVIRKEKALELCPLFISKFQSLSTLDIIQSSCNSAVDIKKSEAPYAPFYLNLMASIKYTSLTLLVAASIAFVVTLVGIGGSGLLIASGAAFVAGSLLGSGYLSARFFKYIQNNEEPIQFDNTSELKIS